MAELRNWTKLFTNQLEGEIYNDHRFEDGQHVRTSPIETFDEKNKIATTRSGTVYHLGVSAKEMADAVKNARGNDAWV